VIVTGESDSADFPVTPGAVQRTYAGPAPAPAHQSGDMSVSGDLFAARLDAASGVLLASTFFGGPEADSIGETAVGEDGSVYFLPKRLVSGNRGMPVTSVALISECPEPCRNGYAARLSPSLDRLLYGTYLPGVAQATAKLHSDGSVYYAGTAEAGFPTTPGAYQSRVAGREDGIVARLDPSGSKLLFATYVGGPDADWILRMTVAPDGSVWAAVNSFVECCIDIQYRLVHLDSTGQRLLADLPVQVEDLAVNPQGNLIAIAGGDFMTAPDAFLPYGCGSKMAYLELNPTGAQVFATYLPARTGSDFEGVSEAGQPILAIAEEWFEIVEGDMGVFAGCVVDAASFGDFGVLSPGAIVTLFGSRMGPPEGAAFELQDGRVPTSVGGTRVIVDEEPVPVLYASYGQVNVILSYSLEVGAQPKIQVESNGEQGNELAGPYVQRAGISLFRLDDSANRPAVALNEDGMLNSPGNPARSGTRVTLYGTGGGATVPASVAGEITFDRRVLEHHPEVRILGGPAVSVEYAGAAPGFVSGVTQIEIRLPAVIPEVPGFPPGLIPLQVPGTFPGYVTVAVAAE
jgi:uncharacterized protein (TIGR03437 family)